MIWMSGEFCDVLPPKDSVLTARKGLSVAAAWALKVLITLCSAAKPCELGLPLSSP